jgi:catechol 2,3-dioxygenase-like lactoylglutathione lyase family enzyme
MSSTAGSSTDTIDMGLEVVTLPVSDVDRAKRFYESLGWRTDADIVVGDSFRAVQVTPTRSACSIAFGKGLTTAEPGSAQRLILVVSDIDAARDLTRGADVSELARRRACSARTRRVARTDACHVQRPGRQQMALQEVATRLPGRSEMSDSPARAAADLRLPLESRSKWR